MTTTTLSRDKLTIDTGDGVTVEISTDTLREHDWIPESEADKHCDCDLDASYSDGIQEGRRSALKGEEGLGVGELLKRFHDDTHEGTHRFCYEEPCKSIREELG